MSDLDQPPVRAVDETAPPERDAPPALRPTRRTLWIAGAAGAVLLALGVWLVIAKLPRFLTSGNERAEPAGQASATADARKIHASLFYVSESGAELVSSTHDVLYAETPSDQIKRILEAQIAAPPDGAHSAIPPGTTVRAVFVTPRHEAFVDLGGTITSGHSGGTLDEALTVYAIVEAVIANVRDIVSVQILIDGKQVDTLAGHLDLRRPLTHAPTWVRKGS